MKEKDALLTMLHGIQDRSLRSYLPSAEIDSIGKEFLLSRGKIRGIATYYSMFSLEPRGRYVIRLCVSPICRMMGSRDIAGYLAEKHGLRFKETTEDGLFTLEETQCLGQCAGAPAMMVGTDIHEKLTPQKIDLILEEYRKKPAAPGGGT